MRKRKRYDPALYQNTPILDLILIAIYSLISKGEICTFEELVKECFDLFPKSFSFEKNFNWPDSRKLDRSLRTLRKRGLIIGTPNTFFSLTKNGQNSAIEISKSLRQRKLL